MPTHQETQATRERLLRAIEKQFGKGGIVEPSVSTLRPLPTGSLALDHAVGIGGYPRGRIIEIYGPESSGKTTLAMHALREAQRNGGIAAFIDAEHAFNVTYAKTMGLVASQLLVFQPNNGEQALDVVESLTRSGNVAAIAIDSVTALTPKVAIKGEMGDVYASAHASLMSRALGKLTSIAHQTQTTLIFLNQLRPKRNLLFGPRERTTGGHALSFYASLRLDVRRLGPLKEGDNAVGSRTRVQVVKNKCAAAFKVAEFDIRFGMGIDAAKDLLDVAMALGIVTKEGAHLVFKGASLGQRREHARQALDQGTMASPLRAAVKSAHTSRLGEGPTPTARRYDQFCFWADVQDGHFMCYAMYTDGGYDEDPGEVEFACQHMIDRVNADFGTTFTMDDFSEGDPCTCAEDQHA
jgi:recombination protein RecA